MGARGVRQVHRFKGALRSIYTVTCILALAGVVATIEPAQAHSGTNLPVIASNPFADSDQATAFRIDVNTDPPGITDLAGSGEYATGELLRLSAPVTVDDIIKPDVQYRFAGWKLPNGETMGMANLSVIVSAPGTFKANYGTFYLLTLKSYDPKVDKTSWHIAGSTSEYNLDQDQVPLHGFWGLLGGFNKAINAEGTHRMDAPYAVNIIWAANYTIPMIIIIAVVLLCIGLLIFFSRSSYRKIRQGAVAALVKKPQSAVQVTAVTEVYPDEGAPAARPAPASKPNYCPYCGNPLHEDDKFCIKCGRKLM